MFTKFASVILDVSIDKVLDYGIPPNLEAVIHKGSRVEVPLRGHLKQGFVILVKENPDFPKVLPIQRAIHDESMINEDLFELGLWMARYYCTSLRQIFKSILPASLRKEIKAKEQLFVMRGKTKEELREHCENIRGKHSAQAVVLDEMLKVKKGILLTELLEKTKGTRSPVDTLAKKGYVIMDIVRVDRSPLINEEYFQTRPKKLNYDQENAFKKISLSLEEGRFETHLLFGVTGSGKTEIYLQAIEKALNQNKGAVMLVPEISLTAQTIERFRSRFHGKIAVLHHRLSHGERTDEWHRIKRGNAKIVIGARSAIFSPIANLGLLIVDEEHEQSYKQGEEMPAYHARDIAVMRGMMQKATVILGSATPSLESFYNAQLGKYTLSRLHLRAENSTIPKVTIVDMKEEYIKTKGYTNFSDPLLAGIKKRCERGEQSILFLNRRGYHTTLLCQKCRMPVRCAHCDVSLTFHQNENLLSCHLCGYKLSPPPSSCPSCHSPDPMKYKGVGTENIESSLQAILPNIRTLRIDADTTRHKGSHQKLLKEFGTGKADVLIGTQMIAKGLHFPEVTLVGVLNADASLNIPDFRASETAFQLITQVAGRAGRGIVAGEVIIQTCMPDNMTIGFASQQNYEAFYQSEIQIRQAFHYPPFSSMTKVAFSGKNQLSALDFAEKFRSALIPLIPEPYQIHPVIAAGHAKVKDQYKFQFLIRGPGIYPVSKALYALKERLPVPSQIKIHIDINPISTFF